MVRASSVSVLIFSVFFSASGIFLLIPQEAEAASSRVIRLRGVVHIYGGARLGPGFSAPVEETADEPPATEDMVAWYRGDSLQGSGTATSWDDKTANGRDATAFNTISIIESGLDTRSVARLARNGDNSDYFHWDGDAGLDHPFSAVVIIKPNAATGFGPALGSTGVSLGTGFFGSNTEDSLLYASGFGYILGTDIVDSNWHVVEGVFDDTTSDIFVDGVDVGSVVDTPGSVGISDIVIGSADLESTGLGIADFSYAGDIAEVIIYNRELTSGERTELEAYVAEYYGL